MHVAYVLGIDGGQSETRCVVGRRAGTIAAIGTGTGVDHVLAPGGHAHLQHALTSASRMAVRALPPEPIEVVYLALSGVVPPGPEADAVARIAAGLWPEAAIHISHDLRAAWAGAFALQPGIVVVAGSGSAAFGVGPDRREARAGGWGYLFGDEGAGWWLGREGIAAALRAQDGTGPPTQLATRLPAHFGMDSAGAIVKAVYAQRLDRIAVAAAGQVVLDEAAGGDRVSQALLERAAEALAGLVVAVKRTLAWRGVVPIAPAGRVLGYAVVREHLRGVLAQRDAQLHVHPPAFPPSAGAFLLALAAAGEQVSPKQFRASWTAAGGTNG